jgi:lipopolysaccharide/colanic/teichoic acid biosynthesis glycosyltransferase
MQQVIAFISLIVLLPILSVCIIVLLLSGSKPFFTQERLGKSKTTFLIYKLRTMKNDRITIVGKVLRKTGLDEIPQLLNIISGDMAFVGPRPLMENDVIRLGWADNPHSIRWSVKPGITGLAQLVNVCDKNVTWQNDVHYIKNKSTTLDIKIVFRSMLVPVLGKAKAKELIHHSSK